MLAEHMSPEAKPVMKAITVKDKDLEKLEGQYLISIENRVLNVSMVDGGLTINGRQQLIPTAKNTFAVEGQEGEYQFSLQDGTTLLRTPSKFEYRKVDTWNPEIQELKDLAKDFWSEELETVYHVEIKDGDLSINHRWIGSVPLEPITKDFFKAPGFFVRFNRSQEGTVTGLSIHSGRTLNVNFDVKD